MSSDTLSSELFQSSYFTSGFETASLLSSNPQTAFLSGDLFSQVVIPTSVPAHIRLPEYYTAEHSRPLTPNFADYPLRVDGITIYDPQNDPRFPILAERFINNNDLLSHKRKETERKRLQTSNLELKFEVKVKFQGLNPHPIFHVSKIEHKTSPALRLVRQHPQPFSSDTLSSELFQSSYFTSGFETASLLSSNPQTAFLSGDLFSQVVIPTPVPAHIRLPEYYTAEHSRPLTPNFADYPLRVDGITIYDPQNDPRFPILAERFINNNDLLSHKRKETERKRLQTSNLELKFEVKVKFQGLNPHPIFHVSKIEHKTSPAPFEVVHIEFERDLNIPTITYGNIVFCNPYSGLKYTTSF